jgi:Protein of unknown function (DUF4199)
MNPILSAGLLIGVLCGLWTFLMGVTGWYKDPVMVKIFLVVVLIEIGGLIWGLRRTAAEGRGYASQVIAGTMMAIVAGVVVICSSLLFTMVLYPDYFGELEAMQAQFLRQRGVPESEIVRRVSESRASNTPMGQALQGFVYTLITGIVASGITAIWVRARHPVARSAAQS